jgi:ketosteroid isomerase-like protein
MKKVLLLALLVSTQYGCAKTQVRQDAAGDPSFQAFLPQWEAAQSRFINGDPSVWKKNAAQGEDATIFGAFGGHEKGWKEVGPRYDWASSQFKESGAKQKIEYLNSATSGDLAFTVAIERQEEVRLGDQNKPAARALRVTQVFRKEGGVWRLLHRHADPLIEKKAPSTVPQK